MENFNQTVRNFFHILKTCNAEQHSLSNEVLETFSTFVYEILLAFRIRVGSSDTIDVKQLLVQDLVELSHHFQPEANEQMFSYLERLQEAKKDSLSRLHRTIAMCKDNPQVAEKEVLETKLKEDEMTDLLGFLTVTTNLIEGIVASNPNDIHLKSLVERMKEHRGTFSEKTSVSEHRIRRPNHNPSTKTTCNPSIKMDFFEQTVMNFCRTLEACSAEQRSVANEVLKSFSTFVEEILLAFHITVGSSDTINVKQLLFQDLVDLSRHLQPEQHENINSYLRKLQEAKENRLRSLHRTITMCSDNLQVAEREVLQKAMKEEEKIDLTEFLTMTTNLIQGIIASNPNDRNLKTLVERMKDHRGTFSFKDKVMDVEEINKRNLGKMIVRCIGNEGNDEKPGLRRLLQACIDFLQTEAEGFWKNASITIYDEDDNMYKIASGTRKHQFICRMKNGEPFIKEKTSVSEHKKPKPNHKPPTDSTHDPSQKRHDPSKKEHNSCSVC